MSDNKISVKKKNTARTRKLSNKVIVIISVIVLFLLCIIISILIFFDMMHNSIYETPSPTPSQNIETITLPPSETSSLEPTESNIPDDKLNYELVKSDDIEDETDLDIEVPIESTENSEEEIEINPLYDSLLSYMNNSLVDENMGTLSLLKLSVQNTEDLNKSVDSFNLATYVNDIESLVLNIVNPVSYVEITEGNEIFIAIPGLPREEAIEIGNIIAESIVSMFNELFGYLELHFLTTVSNYPQDSNNMKKLIFIQTS